MGQDTDLTDVAVVEGARVAGLSDKLRLPLDVHAPFVGATAFHDAVVEGRLCVEGAAEALVPRCDRIQRNGSHVALDEAGRDALLGRARALAERGLRALMVAEGPPDGPTDDPNGLVALSFLGISDPSGPPSRRRCAGATTPVSG